MPAPLTLPVISISPYLPTQHDQYSDLDRARVAQDLHRACRDIGFFYLKVNDYVTETERQRILDSGREFFLHSTEEEKATIGLAHGDGARGYQKLKQNITMGKADHHEGLDLYADSPYAKGEELDAHGKLKPLGGKNQWPNRPAGFQEEMQKWIEKMKVLGLIVMKAMADGLGMTESEWQELQGMVEDSFWVTRVIGYPPLPEGAQGVSCGAHKDYGCLTLLHTDDTSKALQVFLRPTPVAGQPSAKEDVGVWIDADPIDGCFVVNVGEMWEVWTNGLYRSTLHRVIHRSPKFRVSLPFFFEPAFDAEVRPLHAAKRKIEQEGWIVENQGTVERTGVRYGDFLISKVVGNFVDTDKPDLA
ncbi:hypothetical protein NliqN6_3222 [Naganishia liquefaciens]|uniref:Fe2OG dioxygenase domain-containing protein n=1 Tax=Naganishia liquefaciens TaxID=104408 RepID=A0A8H3TUA9_9TREE|nr:hypothetical protein NliqN6_3222 [Naganishia liquefaciens]